MNIINNKSISSESNSVITDNVIYDNGEKHIKGELITKGLNHIYFSSDYEMILISNDENILISNIDSPNSHNSILCDCGNYMFKTDHKLSYYYCPNCKLLKIYKDNN